jgi:hypothetical protein
MLSTWGTTPGKSLLNIQIRKTDNSIPTYGDALSRSFNVWLKGLGIGIRPVAIIALIYAYIKLSNNGTTSWDQVGEYKVFHKEVGIVRAALVCLYFTACLTLVGLLSKVLGYK